MHLCSSLTYRMMLADAHMVAIRKLLLPVWTHMLFAPPGPPLPSNHPSPSLLAKLHLHVASLYTSSAALFHAHVDGKKNKKQDVESVDGQVIPELSRYLRKESVFSSALAHKWLAVEAGEAAKSQRVGESLAWLKEAQSRLRELEDGKMREKMKGLSLGRKSRKEERSARKDRVERELEDMAAWARTYQRMNDTVSDTSAGGMLIVRSLFNLSHPSLLSPPHLAGQSSLPSCSSLLRPRWVVCRLLLRQSTSMLGKVVISDHHDNGIVDVASFVICYIQYSRQHQYNRPLPRI